MQLYRINYSPAAVSCATKCTWAGSQTDAAKTRAKLRSNGHEIVETLTVDVPTSKGPLLEWLNANVKQ